MIGLEALPEGEGDLLSMAEEYGIDNLELHQHLSQEGYGFNGLAAFLALPVSLNNRMYMELWAWMYSRMFQNIAFLFYCILTSIQTVILTSIFSCGHVVACNWGFCHTCIV